MAPSVREWLRRFRRRPVDPFSKAAGDGLDLIKAPGYDMSDALRAELRAEVDELMGGLLPGAVDAYSGGVLDGWLDARAQQIVARLDAEREECQAVAEAVIGLARQEVAKRKSRYDADLDRVRRTAEASAVTRQRLIGDAEMPEVTVDDRPLGSTLGAVTTADLLPVNTNGRERHRSMDVSDGAPLRTDSVPLSPFVPSQEQAQEVNGRDTTDDQTPAS